VMKRLREAVNRKRPDFWRGENMVASSWPCSSTFSPFDLWFSHKMWDDAHPLHSVLTRICTNRLLSLHQAEILNERKM